MITIFGSINVDLVCRVSRIPRPGETVLAPGYQQVFGGKGANMAVAAARALGERGRVVMVGAVGRDALGEAAAANLEREGVAVADIVRVDEPTGCAFITVEETGENAITVASGANRLLRSTHLTCRADGAPGVTVMQMEVPFGETLAVATEARRQGGQTVVNFAPVPSGATGSQFRELLAVTDILVVNEHELRSIAAVLEFGQDAPLESLAAEIAAASGSSVVATLGPDGALLAAAEQSLLRIAALPVDAVDTTGAGDTLVGVLAAGLDAGLDLPRALTCAVAAASLACRKLGAQTAMPTAAEIDAALR